MAFDHQLVYTIYSIVLLVFPLCLFILVILQKLSDEFSKKQGNSKQNKSTKIKLYLVYLAGMFCSVIGYSLHSSMNEDWCETFGFLPCFLFLGLSKAALYLFFLHRAELAQGFKITACKTIFFRYIGPFYLFIYWLLYCVLTSFVFSGKLVMHETVVSNCVFAKGAWWFSVFAGCIDIFNTIIALIIFIHPLMAVMKTMDKQKLDEDHTKFVSMLKWNIFLALIAATSSVVSVFMFYTMQEYVWLFCLGDPCVNGICTFFMIARNRKFTIHLFYSASCQTKQKKRMQITTSQMTVAVTTSQSNPSNVSVQTTSN